MARAPGVVAPEQIEEKKKTPEAGAGDQTGGPQGPRIRCPLCGWQPQAQDRWMCHCRHVWNTFDTGGVCPGCMYQWKVTQCLSCARLSAHSDWYARD